MPKKAHGRQAKQKPRARRSTTSARATVTTVEEDFVRAPAVTASPATTAPRPAAARPAAPRPGAARRSPTITINYAYLHRDLVSLGILGPAMIALLIIAYLIFHGA